MHTDTRLPFSIPSTHLPLHERLADAIEKAIATGSLNVGERLPTHREISSHFGVAIGTVTKAIDSLSRRGIVRGEVGRGTFVQSSVPATAELVDLTINAPLPVIKPELMLSAAERAVRVSMEMPSGGYVDLAGTSQQRSTVAAWLSRTRIKCEAEELVLCTGAQQAIHLAFAELRAFSSGVVSEAHTFPGALAAAANLGLKMFGVAYDDEGMDPSSLDDTLSKCGAKTVYLTPVCQNPLAFETGPERRQAIVDVCRRHGAYIVEDDIYGLYASSGSSTFKELMPDRVFYLTSLSKSVSPLVRLGVLFSPPGFRQPVTRRMRAEVWGGSPLSFNIGCSLLDLGAYEACSEALRSEAVERVKMAYDVFGGALTGRYVCTPHVWLPMSMIDAERLARRSSEKGVRLTPPDATAIDPKAPGGLRICLLAPKRRGDLERAMNSVRNLIEMADEAVI
jgi:DNA-binding transcriptional MocR family regulator